MAVTNSTELYSSSKLMICLAIAGHDAYMQLRYNTMCMMSCIIVKIRGKLVGGEQNIKHKSLVELMERKIGENKNK